MPSALGELVGDRLEHGGPGVVGPDHEVGVTTGGRLVHGGLGRRLVFGLGGLGCLGGVRGVGGLGLGSSGVTGRGIAVAVASASGAHQGGYGSEGDQAA